MTCPTTCKPACPSLCHESHYVAGRRGHSPLSCQLNFPAGAPNSKVAICDQRPKVTVSGPSEYMEGTVKAMVEAFSCSLQRGHDGDHKAHDRDGDLLCWWS